jgi:cytochrome c-type biogenesis protein CcmF
MATLGYTTLLIACALSIYSVLTFLIGARNRYPRLVATAKFAVFSVFILFSISVSALVYSLSTHDFQIEYVASYTSQDMSLAYLVSALWAGNAGSLLFWGWLISLFAAVLMFQKLKASNNLLPYASVVIMLTQIFFLVLLLFIKNPFHTLIDVPSQGIGLNPLLEHAGMLIHPPLLLAGYAALTIPFAFAIAALLMKQLDNAWINGIRKWTLAAWLLLGMGILTGSWWSYAELGWGGYWSWDPVENTSLMPWLMTTAFLHSIIIQRRREILKSWNIILIILTFGLIIFGAFITRSGIISSLHSFSESSIGPFFLAFLGFTCFFSLLLLIFRHKQLRDEGEVENLLSREGTFFLNNLLLVGATLVIFIGTVITVVSEAVGGINITVNESFFNQVSAPFFLAIILLTGVCIVIGWRPISIKQFGSNTLWPLIASLLLIIILAIVGIHEWYVLIAVFFCSFLILTTLFQWGREIKARIRSKTENYLMVFIKLIWFNKNRYGAYIVHVSIALMAVGIIGSSVYDVEKEAALLPGESMTINSYTLTYEDLDYYPTPNKMVFTANVSIYNHDKYIGKLAPQKYFHRSFNQSVSEIAIRSTITEDLYLVLIGWDDTGTTHFQALVNPLVIWIWIGGILFLLGGLIALWPERQGK